MNERPDGSVATLIGWVLVAIGVLAAFFVSSADSPSGFWLSIAISNLGIGLGVLLLSLGYLVRAIWFLPGRELPTRQMAQSRADPALGSDVCAWCAKTVSSPARPCSALTAEELPVSADRVQSKVCRSELEARGQLV